MYHAKIDQTLDRLKANKHSHKQFDKKKTVKNNRSEKESEKQHVNRFYYCDQYICTVYEMSLTKKYF